MVRGGNEGARRGISGEAQPRGPTPVVDGRSKSVQGRKERRGGADQAGRGDLGLNLALVVELEVIVEERVGLLPEVSVLGRRHCERGREN